MTASPIQQTLFDPPADEKKSPRGPHKDHFEQMLELHGMSEREWSKKYDTDRKKNR